MLWSTGSRRAGPSSCGSQAPECRLSSCGSRAQLLRDMWDLPGPGLEHTSPALAGRLPVAAPPGKPLNIQILRGILRGYSSARNTCYTVTLLLESTLALTTQAQHPCRWTLSWSLGWGPAAEGAPAQRWPYYSEEQTAEGVVKEQPKSVRENLLFPYMCMLMLDGGTELSLG